MRLVESGWERPKIMRVYPGCLDRSVSLRKEKKKHILDSLKNAM